MKIQLSDLMQCDKIAHKLIGLNIVLMVAQGTHSLAKAAIAAAAASAGRSLYKYLTRGAAYDATEDMLDTAMLVLGAVLGLAFEFFLMGVR